jgi:NAD(P)-dependent dehydrogenase (short-subunit alcohol dehydrogenase family)
MEGGFMSESPIIDLRGKKALVTGGASGIGKACALGMAGAGADVAIVDLQDRLGQETVEQIREMGRRSIFVSCDVTNLAQVDAMVKTVVDAFGGLDIAFNNAGVSGSGGPTIEEEALKSWDETLAVNLNGVFYCCRAEGKHMVSQRYGRIINAASMSATIINNLPVIDASLIPYCVSKAAVRQLTRGLALEWAQWNVHVNCISPGYIETPLTDWVKQNPQLLEHWKAMIPLHRLGRAEEIVGGVLYLASDAASYTTGCDLIMDGGCTVW